MLQTWLEGTGPAESRYALIEGEALVVVDALNKARHFVSHHCSRPQASPRNY